MIMKLTILLAVLIIVQQVYCNRLKRIVGGDIARPGQFKCQVSLQVDDNHICGGCIISGTHVLTAAHCIINPYINNMVVVTGIIDITADGEKYNIKCIRVHPNYTDEYKDDWKHDIAVITLKKPIKINNVQGPIPLASKNYINGGKRGTVSGWGKIGRNKKTASKVLRWIGVNVLSQQYCLQIYNPITNKNQICTLKGVGIGVCQGDSGGPLIVDNELVGVVSWVIPCALGFPDVHTKVVKYLYFIKESQSMC